MTQLATLVAVLMLALPAAQTAGRFMLGERVSKLTRDSPWKPTGSIPVTFITHHPQGMVRIGNAFFVSSVEVRVRPERHPRPVDGYDRTTGEGEGHLFKIAADGALLADLRLGEGSMYHPGGIDFDGRWIWVPVAEYRPNSRSILYRVDPQTMKATEVLRVADHIGGIVHNTDDHTLHGVSWGSRRFYRWTLGRDDRVAKVDAQPAELRTLNPSHYVDYQDCKYAGRRRMLCTGVAEIRQTPAAAIRLGGMDLVDLTDGRPVHQVPVLLWTPGGLDMTHNPAWIEPAELPQGPGLRAWFMPEDDRSTIYVYEVVTR